MDPFHVVRLAGDALDRCRRRIQQQVHGHRGRAGDPLYGARRTLHTGADLLTPKQQARLDALRHASKGCPPASNGPNEPDWQAARANEAAQVRQRFAAWLRPRLGGSLQAAEALVRVLARRK